MIDATEATGIRLHLIEHRSSKAMALELSIAPKVADSGSICNDNESGN
jgi:hypothetical protein